MTPCANGVWLHLTLVNLCSILQCVMNPETGEPTDDLLPQAIDMIAALGSHCTKVSEVVQQQDQAVYAAIQKGLDKVNEHAETTVHTVSAVCSMYGYTYVLWGGGGGGGVCVWKRA